MRMLRKEMAALVREKLEWAGIALRPMAETIN